MANTTTSIHVSASKTDGTYAGFSSLVIDGVHTALFRVLKTSTSHMADLERLPMFPGDTEPHVSVLKWRAVASAAYALLLEA